MTQNENSTSISFLSSRRPSIDSRERDVPAVWHVGDVILDLYEVKDVFWPGARGLVYRVHHREWDIDLAVKSPRETPFESEKQTRDFVEAADDWVSLGLFPHIVSCYYARMLGGIPRLFLEFVEGSNLHDWIRTRRLYEGGKGESLKRILDIAIQFAWGLKHAHDHNVSHPNLKLSHVLLTADGTVKITGFASAREGVELESDRDGVPANSVFFSSQQPDNQELSRQKDIWSWAGSVLDMFSGEWDLRYQLIEGGADYLERGVLDDYLPAIPAGLAVLFGQCLQSDPAQRRPSMAEIAGSLRQIYKQETGSDHPRRLPIQASLGGDDLNNRALSLLDLGRADEALWLWDEALVKSPQHVEATYNSQLVRWRLGRATDDGVITTLNGLRNSGVDEDFVNLLLSRIHLERGDAKAATEILENIEGVYADQIDASDALTLRNVGLESERPLTAFFDDEIHGPNQFTPDGKSLLLTVSGCKIRILDFDSPLSPRYLEGHTQGIYALAISADSQYALTSSDDATIRLWDLSTAKCVRTIADEGWTHPNILALSAGGTHAVLRFDPWSEKATLQLWDMRSELRIRDFETTVSEFGEPQSINAVSISPDGRYVLSGGKYGTVQLWDVSTGKVVRDLKGLWGSADFVQFSPDGRSCFAANDREVREFDIYSGTCLEVVTVDQRESDSKTSRVTVSADGTYALFGSSYGELKLWEVNTGRCVRTFQDLTDRPYYEVERYQGIESVNLSPDGKYSLSGTRGGTYKLWRFNPEYRASLILSRITATEEAIDKQLVAEQNLANARLAIDENRFVDAANHVRAARSVPGYERSREAVELWTSLYVHLPRTRVKASWLSHEVRGQELVSSISFDADGKYVLFGGVDPQLKEVASDRCLRVFDKSMHGKVALSGDARLAMVGGWDYYELWDTGSGKLINKTYSSHEKHVEDIKLSVDGKYAVSCTEKAFNPWEITRSGLSHLRSTHTDWGELSALAISSDNKYCVAGTGFSSGMKPDYRLRLWELPSVECIKTFDGYDSGTYALVFSPDNKYFLGGGYDHKLRLWEVATGECVRLFEGHSRPVYSVDISSDGKFAISGSTDQTMRLWEVSTGECLRTWEIKTDFIGPVRFTSDCKYVLANTTGFVVRVEVLDWELEDREPSDWDEGARPYLHNFLTLRGAAWSEDDFDALLFQLGGAGYGWLRPKGIRRELEKMSAGLPAS
jgi:WD40 repeat protein/serine/threonine protein kinase